MRGLAIGLLGAIVGAPLGASAQGSGCSHDLLHVAGAAVSVTLCPGAERSAVPGNTEKIPLTGTFASGGKTFSRTVTLEFMKRHEASRSLDDVSLEPLGISKTLHLTIAYQAGTVRLDHALLIPGAVTLK